MDQNWEISILKSEKDKYIQMVHESESNLSNLKIDFEVMYKDYQEIKQSLNNIVQVILAKDREWDMKAVLAAVESQTSGIDDKTKNALEGAMDKIKALSTHDDILRSTLHKSAVD